MTYDVIIIGAGPGGIFSAYELMQRRPEWKVVVLEAGNPLEKRHCPIDGDKVKSCIHCKTCAIMNGFGGAGAFSDGKYNLTNAFGGTLYEYIGKQQAMDLMRYVDDINMANGGAGTRLYSTADSGFKRLCLQNNLHLLDASVRHLGTDINYKVLENLYAQLKDKVEFHFLSPVKALTITDDGLYEAETDKGAFRGRKCIISVGRSGSKWMEQVCRELDIATRSNRVDIGVRGELPYEVCAHLTDELYESKIVYRTEKFQDRVRTFCMNPKGAVVNEITNGMCGETDASNVRKLLASGSKAVRDAATAAGKDILVAVHYPNIDERKKLDTLLTGLQVKEIDYDIVGLSFYPYWHGTIEDLKNAIIHIRDTYGMKVYVAENAYCYTAEDGDGSANSVEGTDDLAEGYSASVQGQANEVRDVCAAASEAGAEGVFYWEGTWIPVGPADADNSNLWEKYGSGWASSYASGYDPKDAGQYYGGCSWDNQAMFDFTGHPLASLNVFKYLKCGATAPLAVDSIPAVTVACNIGTDPELPDTVSVIYNDRSEAQVPVIWNTDDVAAIDTENGGNFTVSGTLEDGTEVTAAVTVERINYVQNPSFEDADTSMWTVNYSGETDPTDYQVKAADAHSGEVAFHFWSGRADMDFSIEQSFTDLEPGTYELSAFSQGGDLSDDASMELYALVDVREWTAPFKLTTYADWQNPAIPEIKVTDGSLTIGVRYKCNKNSWGTLDDVTLYKIAE